MLDYYKYRGIEDCWNHALFKHNKPVSNIWISLWSFPQVLGSNCFYWSRKWTLL